MTTRTSKPLSKAALLLALVSVAGAAVADPTLEIRNNSSYTIEVTIEPLDLDPLSITKEVAPDGSYSYDEPRTLERISRYKIAYIKTQGDEATQFAWGLVKFKGNGEIEWHSEIDSGDDCAIGAKKKRSASGPKKKVVGVFDGSC